MILIWGSLVAILKFTRVYRRNIAENYVQIKLYEENMHKNWKTLNPPNICIWKFRKKN